MGIFSALSDEDWTGLIVSHPYMGPLPAMFYPMFQLVDYAVHSWDIREGLGQPHGLSGDAADLLIPVIYILWQATADISGVDRAVHGRGAHQRAQRRRHALRRLGRGRPVRARRRERLPAVLEFDPATLVLTGYARINGGTVWGDQAAGRPLPLAVLPDLIGRRPGPGPGPTAGRPSSPQPVAATTAVGRR